MKRFLSQVFAFPVPASFPISYFTDALIAGSFWGKMKGSFVSIAENVLMTDNFPFAGKWIGTKNGI